MALELHEICASLISAKPTVRTFPRSPSGCHRQWTLVLSERLSVGARRGGEIMKTFLSRCRERLQGFRGT
jgi:hypothetical protein